MSTLYPMPTPDEAPPLGLEEFARRLKKQQEDLAAAAQPTGAAYDRTTIVPINKEQEQLDSLYASNSPQTPGVDPGLARHMQDLARLQAATKAPVNLATAPPAEAMRAMGAGNMALDDSQAGTMAAMSRADSLSSASTSPAPVAHGRINYSIDGGPMRDFYADHEPNPNQGGGDQEAYRRYRENMEGPGERGSYARELAGEAIANALTKDPWAATRVEHGLDYAEKSGLAQLGSRIEMEKEQERRQAFMSATENAAARRDAALAEARSSPIFLGMSKEAQDLKLKQIQGRYDDQISTLKDSFGYGEKLSGTAAYGR